MTNTRLPLGYTCVFVSPIWELRNPYHTTLGGVRWDKDRREYIFLRSTNHFTLTDLKLAVQLIELLTADREAFRDRSQRLAGQGA